MVKRSGTFQLFSLTIVIFCLLQLTLSLLPFWFLVPVQFLPSKVRICLTDVSSKLWTLDLEKSSFYFCTLCLSFSSISTYLTFWLLVPFVFPSPQPQQVSVSLPRWSRSYISHVAFQPRSSSSVPSQCILFTFLALSYCFGVSQLCFPAIPVCGKCVE